jgi:uncharacterized protein (TIGR03435 family)
MLTHLADVSLRSLLLALPAAVVLRILRGRLTAAWQHAVLTAVLSGMLVLLAFGQALPRLPFRVFDGPAAPAPAAPLTLTYDPSEAAPFLSAAPPKTSRSIDWLGAAGYLYGAIAFTFLAQFVIGIFLVRKLTAKQTAKSSPAQDFLESPLVAVPLTVGWLRPRILLPLEWRAWNREKLNAVLAHEGAHARRRDGLISALAAVNRCIFWFHPLAWMLERKLALLAEQACDEACVAALGDRERYAHLLLEMALVVDESQGRLRYHAFTMAAASHIRQRIDSLLQEGRTFSRGLTRKGWAAVTLCAIPLVWATGAVEWVAEARPAQTAPQPAAAPKFEVASVKPCKEGETVSSAAGGKKGGGRGGAGTQSPDTLDLGCLPVRLLIRFAYLDQYNWLNPENNLQLEGGPSWIDSERERYRIDAKADGPVGRAVMEGPMLQALLEDRFKLKVHRETRETPLYALTVANGGLKLKRAGDLSCTEPDAGGPEKDGKPFVPLGCIKLQRAEEGDCTPRDLTQFPPPPRQPGDKPPCGVLRGLVGAHRVTTDLLGATMEQIARTLGASGRPVVDKTGLTDKFDFHIEFAPDDAEPSDDADAPPSIVAALQQLGLKLEPAKGPREFLVIDHVERPSEN